MIDPGGSLRSYLVALALSALPAAIAGAASPETAADLLVSDARIHTEDAHHSLAEALAVRGGKIRAGTAARRPRTIAVRARLSVMGSDVMGEIR